MDSPFLVDELESPAEASPGRRTARAAKADHKRAPGGPRSTNALTGAPSEGKNRGLVLALALLAIAVIALLTFGRMPHLAGL